LIMIFLGSSVGRAVDC